MAKIEGDIGQQKLYREGIRSVFKQYVEWSKDSDLSETLMICDQETDNYLLMNIGWQGHQRQHGVFIHLRIIEDKIHVEWNGTEHLIEDLIEFGIPETAFIPAFRHPDLREQLLTA